MDRATYLAACDEAKNEGLPLLGHGPVNLGLGAVFETGQTLAHSNEFHPLYFMVPFEKLSRHFLWIALSLDMDEEDHRDTST